MTEPDGDVDELAEELDEPGSAGALRYRVQKVDGDELVVALRVRATRSTRWAVAVAGRGPDAGFGVVRERPATSAPDSPAAANFRARLRETLVGAYLEPTLCDEHRLVVVLGREEPARRVALVCRANRLDLLALAQDATTEAPPKFASSEALVEALEARGPRVLEHARGRAVAIKSRVLAARLAAASARVARRLAAIRGDVARIDDAAAKAERAALFVPAAKRAARGATSLRVTDWSAGEAVDVEFKLDPGRGAQEQLENVFRRARRLKAAAPAMRARLATAQRELEGLGALESRARAVQAAAEPAQLADVALALAELDAVESEARALAPRDYRASAAVAATKRKAPAERLPYRTFRGERGGRILVARSAEDGDTLTLTIARPHDLWLHAKGQRGAHVIVPLEKNKTCPADLLVEAAHLAAHFGEARGELTVEIQIAERRHVRKGKGMPAGLVIPTREKVLALRVDPEKLAQLLATGDVEAEGR